MSCGSLPNTQTQTQIQTLTVLNSTTSPSPESNCSIPQHTSQTHTSFTHTYATSQTKLTYDSKTQTQTPTPTVLNSTTSPSPEPNCSMPQHTSQTHTSFMHTYATSQTKLPNDSNIDTAYPTTNATDTANIISLTQRLTPANQICNFKLLSLFQNEFEKALKCISSILICVFSSLSPCFFILDTENFVKVAHYK